VKRLLVVIILLSLMLPGCIKLGSGSTADKLPKVHVFQALPDSVEQGQQVMLSWEVSEASSVTVEPGIGSVEPIGSKLVTVTAPTVYTLTAVNRYGKTEKPASVAVGISGGTAVDKPPVQGGGAAPPVADGQIAVKPEVAFKTTPESIGPGGAAELSWDVKYATSISIDQGIGTVAASGKKTVNPTRTTVYTLTANNSSAETVSPVTVTFSAQGYMGILPQSDNKSGTGTSATLPPWLMQPQGGSQTLGSLQAIIPADAAKGSGAGDLQGTFYALPNPALTGQSVRLYWTTVNASRVDLLDDYNEYVKRDMSKSGNLDIIPSGTSVYKLRVTGASDTLDLRYTIKVE